MDALHKIGAFFLNDETGSLLFYRQKFAAIPRA